MYILLVVFQNVREGQYCLMYILLAVFQNVREGQDCLIYILLVLFQNVGGQDCLIYILLVVFQNVREGQDCLMYILLVVFQSVGEGQDCLMYILLVAYLLVYLMDYSQSSRQEHEGNFCSIIWSCDPVILQRSRCRVQLTSPGTSIKVKSLSYRAIF